MALPVLDLELFRRRLKSFYNSWRETTPEVDATVISVGSDDNIIYAKSIAVQAWLLGCELRDVIIVLCHDRLYICAGRKKIEFLQPLQECTDENIKSVIYLTKHKGVDDNRDNFTELIDAIKKSKDGKNVGVIPKDRLTSDFTEAWKDVLDNDNELAKVDITPTIVQAMAPKDESEINLIKKAAHITSEVFSKHYIMQIMSIIDLEKKVSHYKLAESISNAIESEKYLAPNMDPQLVEVCYPPIIQSGGKQNLKFSITSNNELLKYDIITCFFGARYKLYCSNIVRTLLVEPTERQQQLYNLLLEVEEIILQELKEGVKLAEVYDKAKNYVVKRKPELESNFVKSVGFATGIEFRESVLSISPKCTVTVKKGMVFVVNVGFSDIAYENDKANTYGLFVGDTVIVNEDTSATVLTSAKKKIRNIGIFLKNEDEDSEEEDESDVMPRRSTTILESRTRSEETAEDRRKVHQAELKRKLNEEAKANLLKMRGEHVEKKVKEKLSYKNQSLMPRDPDISNLKIYIDKKQESIILPIFGIATPFHISTIKNVSQSVEGDYCYLRINFFYPGSALGRFDGNVFSQPDATFLKELTFRSLNTKQSGSTTSPSMNLMTAFRLIKEVQKVYKTRETEQRERAGIVEQEALIVNPNRSNPRLKEVYLRPSVSQKRVLGTLEAHTNGFRYTSVKGEKIDILYANIKQAFFQPCDHEMVILLHFHLQNAVLMGKKKVTDIQVYTEIGEISADLSKYRHMHDRDDLMAEQTERERRHKLKVSYMGFTEKIENLTNKQVEFDTPIRELSFYGVPHRSTVLLQLSNFCLVHLIEQPVFIVFFREVELIHFERVQFHLKSFDMVIIFKDYSRKVATINSIPMSSLDKIKSWFDQYDIRYTEGIQNLNWTNIMKTINEDPEGFFENGGWNFLDMNDEDNGNESLDESEEDDVYEPSTDEDEDEDYEESMSSAVETDDEEDELCELDSDESEGKDWDELEAEAAKADREKQPEYDEDNNSRKRGMSKSSANNRPKKKSRH
ncbi:FACT complex subunit SPT16 [Trichoplax sp. H2]|nr:FACT complex subunit SPT16 [Trichoplax sp. H2]|eukprot:RDD47106.1 FACT complex subunit SPT16 [Trichoplax sp. H2]